MQRKNRVALAGILLVSLILAGCSFRFLYTQLDWLVPWYVSDYITLDEIQQSELERRVAQRLDWHCSTQLQRYAEWFSSIRDEPLAFRRENLERHYLTTRHFWKVLMQRVADDATTVLMTASDKQLQELLENLEKRNRELERQIADATTEERLEKRRERMRRLLTEWIGDLNERQRGAIQAWSRSLGKVDDEGWMKNRRRWQQRLVEAVKERKDETRLNREIRRLLVEPESLWSESDRVEYQRRLNLTLDMLATVAANMGAGQREHLDKELSSWITQFRSLACSEAQTTASDLN